MFPPARTTGIPPRSLSRAFVTVLALLLSALGGIRLAFDRLGGAEDEATVVVAALAAPGRAGDCSRELALAQPTASPARAMPSQGLAPAALGASTGWSWSPAAPTTRQGSAGGPRSP